MGRTYLLTPGPTNVHNSVRARLVGRDICHKENSFCNLVRNLNQKIVTLLGGDDSFGSVILTCSGTGANEAMISAIEGTALVVTNGRYGERLASIVKRLKISALIANFNPWGPLNPADITEWLGREPRITHVLCVHHETELGIVNPIREIGEVVAKKNKFLLVDAISSVGGHEFSLRHSLVTFCTVSANKCLEGLPGISVVVGRTDAFKKLEGHSRSFYLDLYAHWEKQLGGEMLFTPAIQTIVAFDGAIERLASEGYANRVQRYRAMSARLRNGLQTFGIECVQHDPAAMSNVVTLVRLRRDIPFAALRDAASAKGIVLFSSPELLKRELISIASMGSISFEEIDWLVGQLGPLLTNTGR